MKDSSIYNCSIIELSKFSDISGNLTPIGLKQNFLFNVSRIFYSYEIPIDKERGGHSHLECHQFLIAMSGSFDVELDDGKHKRVVYLNRPNFGLHIPPGVWASQKCFSGGAICMVLASHKYDEKDYVRNYSQFKKLKE